MSSARTRFRARDVWPRLSDYGASLMLLAIPAIALSLAIIAMRNSTYSIQTSVYVVYLKQVGLVGTTIGLLFSAAEIASGFGALFAGRVMAETILTKKPTPTLKLQSLVPNSICCNTLQRTLPAGFIAPCGCIPHSLWWRMLDLSGKPDGPAVKREAEDWGK